MHIRFLRYQNIEKRNVRPDISSVQTIFRYRNQQIYLLYRLEFDYVSKYTKQIDEQKQI